MIAATSVEVDQTQLAMRISARNIAFGAVKLLSSEPPTLDIPFIETIAIPPMDFEGYSRFIVAELYRYVDTSHCLVVQADGFVLNAHLWRDVFLDYDYIGAPWPESMPLQSGSGTFFLGKNRVGNGGFSLRSRKLLNLTSQMKFDALDLPVKSEDLLICHYGYDALTAKGVRFAPPEIAAGFSIESRQNLYGQTIKTVFGFHGKHWRDAILRSVDRNLLMNALTKSELPPS